MPFQQILAFTNDGYQWKVYADYDTQTIQTVNIPDPQIVGPVVNETILGFVEGDTINQRCVGTTLLTVVASYTYPYANFASPVLNSPTCGYTPPVCGLDITTTTTNSINGSNNGSITVNVGTAGVWQYSLDGITYQFSNVFNGLFPGSYTAYVKNVFSLPGGGRCYGNVSVILSNTVVDLPAAPFPLPYKDSIEICYRFRLIVDGVKIEVREPIGWDAITIKGERDLVFHGWEYKYSDGDIKLRFACPQGSKIIEEVFQQDGSDGEIGFEHYYIYQGEEHTLFLGRLMLNLYEKLPDSIKCTVEAQQFDSILLSRMEAKVSMKQDTTFEGSPVTPPSPYDLTLHAKEILAQFVEVESTIKYAGSNEGLHSTVFSILPGLDTPSVNDLTDSNTFQLYPTLGTAEESALWIHKFTEAGNVNLALNWPLNFTVNVDNGNIISGGSFDCKMVYVYKQYDPLSGTFTRTEETISAVVATSVPVFSAQNYDISLTGVKTLTDFPVGVNDEIYFFVFIESNREFTAVSFPFITQPGISYSVQQLQNAGDSQGNVWFLDDALRHIISVISDNKYVFRSTLFERAGGTQLADGQASKRVVTNGFQIRRFDVDERPLKVDLKTLQAAVNNHNCIGVMYRTDAAGQSIVRMERRNYFYRDRQILAIYEIDNPSYVESVALELIYNQIHFGDKVYKTDGINSLDEFNTEQTDLTPIKKVPKTLDEISDVITSGYSIEDSRRQQFEETPANSYENDDNPFMVCVKRDGAGWVTEKNEDFSTVSNLISPSTAYNLRLSPRRRIYNWFIWLKGFLYYKDPTEIIRNTDFVQNGDLITQFNADATDVIGDINKDLIQEKENFELARMADTESIYRPEWVNLKCRLSPDEVQTINDAMVGLSDDTKNHGYIMVKKPDETWQAIWLFEIDYNQATEAATLKGLKKAVSPDAPVVECCEWLVINGCYILVNGNRLIA